MRLALTHPERVLAERLIARTSVEGADATLELLDSFHPDAHGALIAYLAAVAVDARALPRIDAPRYRHNQPDRFTDAQRREAHRRYQAGERTPEVIAGEREAQRVWARQRRERAS